MCAGVVCNFGECEVFVPFLWFVVGEELDVLFECAIGAFCLSVCLWVIGCRETECGLELFEEFAPKGGYESWVAIADDGARDSMNTDDVGDE